MKRKIMLILTVLMVFAFAQPLTAFADEEPEIREEFPCALPDESDYKVIEIEGPQTRETVTPIDYDEAELYFELEEKIKAALLEGKTEIDLRDMCIDREKYEIYYVLNFSPYFCKGIGFAAYSYSSGTYAGMYADIKLTNLNTPEDTKAHFAKVDMAVAEIMGQVSDGMSEEQKALVIHDYFTDQFEYDYVNYKADTIPTDSYRSGGIFLNKIGVCMAYGFGYKYIMNKLGIECYYTSSQAINHGWNIIKINEKYYHVDCTWDDPVADRIGQTGHGYFLVSDGMIKERRHSGWNLENKLKCDDTKYDNAYWVDVKSPIVLQGDTVFYVRYDSGSYKSYLYEKTGENEPQIVVEVGQEQWPWLAAYSGLFLHDGRLYYNTPTQIKSIATDGTSENVEYELPASEEKRIYGLKKYGSKIQYLLVNNPYEETVTPDNKNEKIKVLEGIIDKKIPILGVCLDQAQLTLEEGKTADLAATIVPLDTTEDKTLTWASGDEGIASVSNGTVTARSVGEATITVTTSNGKKTSCKVTVTARQIPITGVTLDRTQLTLEEGKTAALTAAIEPSDTTDDKTLTWESSNAGIATVSNGTVTAISVGEAAITVTTSNGKQANCKVTVTKKLEVVLPFADVNPADWYGESAKFVFSREIMKGMDDNHFGPSVLLSRAQFATILYRMEKSPTTSYNAGAFPDVADGEFYTSPAMWAKSTGVITGYSDGKFGPADDITREQMAVMMYRYANLLKLDTSATGDLVSFPDGSRVSSFAQEAMRWAVGEGLITGDSGKINPQGQAQRSHCATIIMRFMTKYKL